ncbi:MAG TPA: hypothetical protein VGL70_03645 [Candidatus Binatia bacterium]|jgi:hypothetical protein
MAVVIGPLCLGIANSVAVLLDDYPERDWLILATMQPIGALMWYIPLAILVVIPVLVPVLLIFAMFAPCFPSMDRTWRGVLVTVIVLSSVAAGAFVSDFPLQWHFRGENS